MRLPREAETERIFPVPGGAQQQGEGELQQPGFKRGVHGFRRQLKGERDTVESEQHGGSLRRRVDKGGHVPPEQRTTQSRKLQNAAHFECAHAGEHLPGACAFGIALLPQGGKMKKVVGQRLTALALRIQGGHVRPIEFIHVSVPFRQGFWIAVNKNEQFSPLLGCIVIVYPFCRKKPAVLGISPKVWTDFEFFSVSLEKTGKTGYNNSNFIVWR